MNIRTNAYKVLAFTFGLFAAGSASASDWYVDGMYGDDSNSGTKSAPFLHVWRGLKAAQSGDTVHLLPTTVYPSIGITTSGVANAPITVMGDGVAPNLTQVNGGGVAFGIQINPASYVVIKGFDVVAPGPWSGIFVGRGSNHIVISGNKVHDSGLCGVATSNADYVEISHNTINSNAAFTTTGIFCSGIDTYENTDIDDNTGVKMIISGNTIYSNMNTPNILGGSDSDGNGIILDDSRHAQSDNKPYSGKTLIENNIVYGNGGRGIYTYSSDHAIIVNNTTYHNNQDPYEGSWRPGEIETKRSGDVQLYNNITYSDGSGCSRINAGCNVSITVEDGSGLPINIDYNLVYNSQNDPSLEYYLGGTHHGNTNTVAVGSNNFWADPLFKNPETGVFLLRQNSPARIAGNSSLAPPYDIRGKKRPPQGPTELAAFQQK